MNRRFLLIGEKQALWSQRLDHVLARWGKLYTASAEEAIEAIQENDYGLIVIDAGIIEDPASLVSHLNAKQPNASLIVASASPTWRQAKEVLRAGATDYIRKSLDEKELDNELGAVLRSWPSCNTGSDND